MPDPATPPTERFEPYRSIVEESADVQSGEAFPVPQPTPVTEAPPPTSPTESAPVSSEPHPEADIRVLEVIAAYREHIPAMVEYLKGLGEEMTERRLELTGLLQMYRKLKEQNLDESSDVLKKLEEQIRGDYKQYNEGLRGMATRAYQRSSELRRTLGAMAEGVDTPDASDAVRTEAQAAIDALDDQFSAVEKSFKALIIAHNKWTKANKGKGIGNRMGDEEGRGSDYDEFVERPLELEFYNQRIEDLMKHVQDLETEAERATTDAQRVRLMLALREMESQFSDYNDQAPPEVKERSRERTSLEGMIKNLRTLLLESYVPEAALPELELVPMPEEQYESALQPMITEVTQWENIISTLERAGKLTPEVVADLQEELRKYPAKLLELDAKLEDELGFDAPGKSESRARLKALLEGLRERLSEHTAKGERLMSELHINEEQPAAKPVSVGDLRATRERVRASYASVQHRLTLEQRREMRTRLAHFSLLVRRAELEQAVAHATEHAPAIAHATLASMPARRYEVRTLPVPAAPTQTASRPGRGLWGVLGDAFRLK